MRRTAKGLAALLLSAAAPAAMAQVGEEAGGLVLRTPTERVRIEFCGPNLVHVVARPEGAAPPVLPRPWIRSACTPVKPRLERASAAQDGAGAQAPGGAAAAAPAGQVLADAGGVKLAISEANGTIVFMAPDGTRLLGEVGNGPRAYRPGAVEPSLYDVEILFHPILRQGLYGLGQHQSGLMNYQGSVVELAQSNTDIAIPFMVSTAGYGLFWNTAAASRVDNRFPTELKVTAESTDGIDYYFAYGPEMDDLVGQYRALTGQAPMFPRWAYGLFQSMDHYATGAQLEQAAAMNREGGAPMDVVVQDWRWWQRMGDKEFKTAEYPDVPAMLKRLGDRNVHTMISIWPLLSTSSNQYAQTKGAGQLVPGTQLYDPTSTEAADRYWNTLAGPLLAQGWDAFWLDGDEPELHLSAMARTDRTIQSRRLAIGPGAFYSNYFPFAHTANVHDRWVQARQDKRVFLLSRSSFAGVQAHGAASWSGDIANAFPTFEKQIAGGLNFALSGMPYWTTDIGGYYLGVLDSPPKGPDTRDPAFRELYTRWWQYGVFNPLFRTHGKRSTNENSVFSYGDATPTLLAFNRLRYRLLPYLYSLAWQVTDAHGTIMRPLVMDWRTDEKVWNIADQFLFGPALLVNPITKEGARTRTLYLPKTGWTDFWTGARQPGGRWINADAPLERIPLFVRDGSILPLGEVVEHADQDPFGPVELRVYRGADGAFDLYEDEGDGQGYSRGERAIVPIRWDEARGTLTIGKRVGTWKGAPGVRRFRIVFVAPGTGVGIDAAPGQAVEYRGAAITVRAS
ncbi:glycoside hydrolase family 31 protein [Sphingomonas hengshuiensis]|uniref:glycoside hydrolase family 31 protein n=1 Tax=Sphingomonas hengshuiensis TaxID=1609977 RepID=UPI000A9A741A|nr:TIM-barrel domain-containing protein [Sphingomonas hengshuiensis]